MFHDHSILLDPFVYAGVNSDLGRSFKFERAKTAVLKPSLPEYPQPSDEFSSRLVVNN